MEKSKDNKLHKACFVVCDYKDLHNLKTLSNMQLWSYASCDIKFLLLSSTWHFWCFFVLFFKTSHGSIHSSFCVGP